MDGSPITHRSARRDARLSYDAHCHRLDTGDRHAPRATDQPRQLEARLGEPGLIVLDCRFALDDPAYGQRSYAEGHIPGARFADLEHDLSGVVQKGVTGRHPLPAPERLVERLRGWGVDNDSTLVLHDDGPGAFAARAWWLLAWLGKREGVYLLDGGLKAWRDEGLALEMAVPEVPRGRFSGEADPAAAQRRRTAGPPGR